MKLIHISDLHIGKRLNGYSLAEDQRYILDRIIEIATEEDACGVIIAGDIYDNSSPSAEAVDIFDKFMAKLHSNGLKVFAIYGNHDSPERMSFGSEIMKSGEVYFSPVLRDKPLKIALNDDYGAINIFLLPFIKPIHIKRLIEETGGDPELAENIKNHSDAAKYAVELMNPNTAERNILIAHQFVLGSEFSGSEEYFIGGVEGIEAAVFGAFDYVALGHLHRAQNPAKNMRYCGTPLKYSLTEVDDKKSLTVIELLEKGSVSVKEVPLIPLRDMSKIRGRFEEITSKDFYEGSDFKENYLHVTLTDEYDILNAAARLRSIYPYMLGLDYDNRRTREQSDINISEASGKTPLEIFCELFTAQNNAPMTDEQYDFIKEITESLKEHNNETD